MPTINMELRGSMWIAIKHNYMKGFILFSILTILSSHGFTQTVDTTTLTIKGGFQIMNGAVLKEAELDNVYNEADTGKKISYLVQFRIKKDGTIGDDIFIAGLNDTLLAPGIMRAIKRTQGLWTNNSGKDVTAILNIYFIYSKGRIEDFSAYVSSVRIYPIYYNHWNNGKLIYLPPVYVQTIGAKR